MCGRAVVVLCRLRVCTSDYLHQANISERSTAQAHDDNTCSEASYVVWRWAMLIVGAWFVALPVAAGIGWVAGRYGLRRETSYKTRQVMMQATHSADGVVAS